ncbi:MAG: hypothetical protein ACK40Q_08330 [Pseudothermotoga sp.]
MKKVFLCIVFVSLVLLSFGKTLTIWIGGQVAELDETWDSIVKAFEQKYGIKVEVQLFGFDTYYDKLRSRFCGSGRMGPNLCRKRLA